MSSSITSTQESNINKLTGSLVATSLRQGISESRMRICARTALSTHMQAGESCAQHLRLTEQGGNGLWKPYMGQLPTQTIKAQANSSYISQEALENRWDRRHLPLPALKISHAAVADSQGARFRMEDAYLLHNLEDNRTLVGVFDGHGGKCIADYAVEVFPETFENQLKNSPGDIALAFERTFDEL